MVGTTELHKEASRAMLEQAGDGPGPRSGPFLRKARWNDELYGDPFRIMVYCRLW